MARSELPFASGERDKEECQVIMLLIGGHM